MAFRVSVESHIDIPKHIKDVKNPSFWKYGANEWWKLITPYTPKVTGILSESVKIKGKSGSGEIEYMQPYAHYLYKGELMVDPETGSSYAREGAKKVYAGKELDMSHNKHSPLASKEWDKAAAPTQKPKLVHAMQGYIDSGRLKLNE